MLVDFNNTGKEPNSKMPQNTEYKIQKKKNLRDKIKTHEKNKSFLRKVIILKLTKPFYQRYRACLLEIK